MRCVITLGGQVWQARQWLIRLIAARAVAKRYRPCAAELCRVASCVWCARREVKEPKGRKDGMNIDSQTVGLWLQIIAVVVLPIASAIYTWIATRDKDNTVHIKAVEEAMTKQMAMLHSRTDRLETKIQYMPTPQQMSELQGDMQAMQATQEAIQRDITTVRISQNRIEDFLLKK